jgi:ribonuclease T1
VSLAALLLATAVAFQGDVAVEKLPPEARQSLTLIQKNGPFPYQRDGAVFGNREGQLPERGRGYYREYTVKTPGAHDRGARRIVAGQGGEYYYTEDHYRSFRRIIQP